MNTTEAKVRPSYITLRGINLGTAFIKEAGLEPGNKYTMTIEGLGDAELQGTLDKSGFIGGLTKLYREFDLKDGDLVKVAYDDFVLRFFPPPEKLQAVNQPEGVSPPEDSTAAMTVAERQKFKHIHIQPYSPGNLMQWVPHTEPDVYMVFGAISEYTDYRYCCGANQALLSQLGYTAETKPDAILIDRGSDEYLIAEFKMRSSEFCTNHKAEDVDVLVCWDDDEKERHKLPPVVLGLRDLLEQAVKAGDIDL